MCYPAPLPSGAENRALCALGRCRAVRGNGDEQPGLAGAHTTTTAREERRRGVSGTGAPEAFADDRQTRRRRGRRCSRVAFIRVAGMAHMGPSCPSWPTESGSMRL